MIAVEEDFGRLLAMLRIFCKTKSPFFPFKGQALAIAKMLAAPHTDSSAAYDKSVPAGRHHAKLLEVGGKTVVDEGSLLSAGVTSIVSKDADAVTLDTYVIPAEVQALTGYGWSAGEAYNYVDFERKVYVQQVGAIDLGDIPWHTAGTEEARYFNSYSSEGSSVWEAGGGNPKIVGWTSVANVLTVEYPTKTRNEVVAHTKGIAIAGANNVGRPNICDPDKDALTGSQFRSSMAGVILYYELATPIETDISAYLAGDATLDVAGGGTLVFANQHGDGYRIPVPSLVEFTI